MSRTDIVQATDAKNIERDLVGWLEVEIEDGRIINAFICDFDWFVQMEKTERLEQLFEACRSELSDRERRKRIEAKGGVA